MPEQEPKGKIKYLTGGVKTIRVVTSGFFSSSSRQVKETMGKGRSAKEISIVENTEQVGIEGTESTPRVPAFIRILVDGIRHARNFRVSPIPQHDIEVQGSEAYPQGIDVKSISASFAGTANEFMRSIPTQQGLMPIERRTRERIDRLVMELKGVTGIGKVRASGTGWDVGGEFGAVYRGEETSEGE